MILWYLLLLLLLLLLLQESSASDQCHGTEVTRRPAAGFLIPLSESRLSGFGVDCMLLVQLHITHFLRCTGCCLSQHWERLCHLHHLPGRQQPNSDANHWQAGYIHTAMCRLRVQELNLSVSAGSPSRGGVVTVYILMYTNRACPLLFILFLCLFLSYGPFNRILFHKFSQ